MVSINNALRLPQKNLELLVNGKSINCLSKTFVVTNRCFALYPDIQSQELDFIDIDYWAECTDCKAIGEDFSIPRLSNLIGISIEEITEIFQKRKNIFLTSLRTYKLPNSLQVVYQSTGNFIPLSEIVNINELFSVISDHDFNKLINETKELELTIVPEFTLESEDTIIDQNEIFLQLKEEFLNNNDEDKTKETKKTWLNIKDLSWIEDISKYGDRSIETDTGRNNWQAGTDFENIAKQSLEFLGFTIDEAHKGGAGGLDLFCSKPYPLTGECKAGKSVPSRTTEELLKLGGMRLGRERFLESKKLIVGAGKVSKDVITAAHEWKVSIIKAMTLQKLVELKAKYDGAINLFELKDYLQAGQIDDKIDEYIQKVEGKIKIRSRIVQTVKELQDADSEYPSPIEIRTHYNARKQGANVSLDSTKEILIELSSPLAGYLGRDKGAGGNCDRFYYLRDLPCDTQD
ncbi:DUF1802 family protein [Pseudanabaena mucicola]|uniref:DUF1802 family protein n=1 Tax=Pseudanabaena mucicola FACHB-723 TaxID=2692860 RepID=A0ABR7ZT38_9CYAN|nr:DUF1802 family protein [Pseudanabaena mucicola]MBD2186687.1 DUF1802 family protein [Pseudanabaena mucicola FACHB-723]